MLPRDVIHAIFVRWEIERANNPDKYTVRESMAPLRSAEELTKHFFRIADDMGVDHE